MAAPVRPTAAKAYGTEKWIFCPTSTLSVATLTGGTALDISIQADEILRLKQTLNEILASHSGKTADEVGKDSDRDFFMGSKEAKAYGLIDEIVQTAK